MSLLAANTRTRPGIVAQLNPVAKLAASAVIASAWPCCAA